MSPTVGRSFRGNRERTVRQVSRARILISIVLPETGGGLELEVPAQLCYDRNVNEAKYSIFTLRGCKLLTAEASVSKATRGPFSLIDQSIIDNR
jgi:hypothetical protein